MPVVEILTQKQVELLVEEFMSNHPIHSRSDFDDCEAMYCQCTGIAHQLYDFLDNKNVKAQIYEAHGFLGKFGPNVHDGWVSNNCDETYAGHTILAIEELDLCIDLTTVQFRRRYEEETGHPVPNVTDLGASNILEQGAAVQTTLGFMLREVTGRTSVERDIDAYCNAQKYVLQQMFDKFLRLVYRRGLYEITNKSEKRGMIGVFGGTELCTCIMAGRIMFTFARRNDNNKRYMIKRGNELILNDSVSFIGEDGDPLCLSAGLQSVHADLSTALGLIEDVIRCWPQEAAAQRRVFCGSTNVSMV